MVSVQKPLGNNELDIPEDPRSLAMIEMEYLFVQLMGEGTFGKVFRIIRKKDGKQLALKSVFQDRKFKNREKGIFSSLDHMNVPILYDTYYTMKDQNRFLNLVMQLVPTTLSKILKQNLANKRHLPLITIKIYSFQLFKALAYFQDIGLCHRDLKPSNILIDENSLKLLICDYGSGKFIKPNESNVSYMCSRFYRAPELLFGKTDYDNSIDVWSAGCIIAEMVTRDPVFAGDHTVDQIIEIIKIVGSPPKEYFINNAIFSEANFPVLKSHRWKAVFRKYPNVDEHLIDLLPKILAIDRKERWKPVQLLLHPFFDDLAHQKYRDVVNRVQDLFDFSKNFMKQGKRQLLMEKFTSVMDQTGTSSSRVQSIVEASTNR